MFRQNPFDEMRRMQKEMDRMFESFFDYEPFNYNRPLIEDNSQKAITKSSYKQPLADIWDNEKEIIATVELPGINKDDIKINITNDGISLKVEKKDEHKEEDKKKGIYRLERRYSGYYRFIPLQDKIDKKNIDATYKNGILELKIPKVKQLPKEDTEIKVK
jgi:HSP20 family protein